MNRDHLSEAPLDQLLTIREALNQLTGRWLDEELVHAARWGAEQEYRVVLATRDRAAAEGRDDLAEQMQGVLERLADRRRYDEQFERIIDAFHTNVIVEESPGE